MAMTPFNSLSEKIVHEVERCTVENDGTAEFYCTVIHELGVTLEYFASKVQDKVIEQSEQLSKKKG